MFVRCVSGFVMCLARASLFFSHSRYVNEIVREARGTEKLVGPRDVSIL